MTLESSILNYGDDQHQSIRYTHSLLCNNLLHSRFEKILNRHKLVVQENPTSRTMQLLHGAQPPPFCAKTQI